MGLRFRRSFRIVPGVRINLSRSGLSTSIGRPGATLNVGGKRGPRVTVGIPGTGLSYSEQLRSRTTQGFQAPVGERDPEFGRGARRVVILLVCLAAAALLATIVANFAG